MFGRRRKRGRHATGAVDTGPELDEEFERVAGRIRAARIAFIIEPRVRYPGQPGEQVTMFLRDPSGNALEFKSFRHPQHVFTQ